MHALVILLFVLSYLGLGAAIVRVLTGLVPTLKLDTLQRGGFVLFWPLVATILLVGGLLWGLGRLGGSDE